MRIAYHSSGSTMTAAALKAWITSTLSNWPTVGAGTLITVKSPTYPMRIESDVISDVQATKGGKQFAKIRYTGKFATFEFRNVTETDIAIWRAFYNATKGFTLPFIVEVPISLVLVAMIGSNNFPFSHSNLLLYDGKVDWREFL